MAKLNSRKLNLNVGNLRVVKNAAVELAESKLDSSKKLLSENFLLHPVTVEIQGGSNASNVSGTLGGHGNLFSFIGFPYSLDPIGPILKLINSIKLIKKANKKIDRLGTVFSFNLSAPTISQFESVSPIPWASGRSWLTGIERGISGLGYFLSEIGSGRSGGGEQASNQLRSGAFKRTSYFTKLYSDFFKRLTKNK